MLIYNMKNHLHKVWTEQLKHIILIQEMTDLYTSCLMSDIRSFSMILSGGR